MAMAPLIRQLAADDCVLLPWAVCPEQPAAHEFINACGFEYKTVDFHWVKTTPNAKVITLDGDGLHWGMGYHTRANIEPVLLATRGSPRRLATDVHSVVIAPAGEHSAKPDEVYRRIERLYPGPCLELFARRPREHWTCWGDEIPRGSMMPVPSDATPKPSAEAAAPDPTKLVGDVLSEQQVRALYRV